jgi:hypothetical protein
MSRFGEEIVERLKAAMPPDEKPRVRPIYEEMYWQAVERAMNPPPKAKVITEYDPFSKERMAP